jgi:hypothetical protein
MADPNMTDGSARVDRASIRLMDSVDLYWIPLGAGARVVRASGRL